MNSVTVDARYLLCPLPVIRTQDQAARLSPGDCMRVLCTDPGVLHDIPCWCRIHGHTVDEISRQGEEIAITIRVGDGGSIPAGNIDASDV
jgi:tRNA 2-thiouridine synthesizing protein A